MDEKRRFLYDYGTLKPCRHSLDLTSLWWDDEKEALLQAWRMTVGKGRADVSDYDKHRALCEMMPYLNGHPAYRHCRDFLRTHFAIDLSMDVAHCDEIWNRTAELLLLKPISTVDLIPDGLPLLSADAVGQGKGKTVFFGNPLTTLSATDWSDWQGQIVDCLNGAAQNGCDRALLRLSASLSFVRPDPYHVGQALESGAKDPGMQDLLVAQCVRFLCEECLRRGWTLHLEIASSGETATRLLSYAEQSVGLPKIVWSTAKTDTRDAMLAFGFLRHAHPVLPVLSLADHPSDGELTRAVEAYAARYPIGLLGFVCGCDARNNRAERARLQTILKETESENGS